MDEFAFVELPESYKTKSKKKGDNTVKVDEKEERRRKKAAEFARSDMIDNPRVFLFVLGGLSHQEIVAL